MSIPEIDSIAAMTGPLLTQEAFFNVVQATPLVAIDLLVHDGCDHWLVGHRTNPPARGFWFVPGGRIRKGETLDTAFRRIASAELGRPFERSQARLHGLCEHFYEEDFTGAAGSGTHYVVLAHVMQADPATLLLPLDQHDGYRWVTSSEGRADASIHPNTRLYWA